MSQVLGPRTGYLRCSTAVTRYAGFDGRLAGEIRRFDRAVVAAGWSDTFTDIDMPIRHYAMFRGRRQGGRTYDASNLPRVEYRGTHPVRCGGVDENWELSQRWLEAGQPVPSPESLGGLPESSVDALAVYKDRDPLDDVAIEAALLARHRYVAVVTLSLQCAYDVDT